ncbi:hypothetical protein L602_002400000430 [Cupriavidus gilardii J11]|uniref:Uncharacterized protein n=1 Tax=Cupriavidus gilardii J11 TaxID=936133 RepID=A0A562BJX0_9BURK|nr:hypothetical protein L602_002400000430 [Cupriavidus gilardii J11]
MASLNCWPEPLYGMCVMSTPAASFTCSSMICPSEPCPEVDHRISPGCAFARASSARKSAALLTGVASNTTGEYAMLATGWTSCTGSNGILLRCGVSVSVLIVVIPMV